MKSVIIDLEKNLLDGGVLVFRDGKIGSTEIHALLPDLMAAKAEIQILKAEISELKKTIADLAKIMKEK